jgi:TatD DNase family protein
MLIDSHCHLDQLDLNKYSGDLALALQAAEELGVKKFLCVCIDLNHYPQLLAIAGKYPQVWATLGLHPTESIDREPSVDDLVLLADHPKVIGIGETGLDYYRCEGDTEWQRERFRTHIRAAKALQKPIIVHSRMARDDTITILKEERADTVGGVLHCFTESWEMAQAAIDIGFYISFSGIVTFPNAKELRAVAQQVPLERILIETDAPYLAPVPYRGKPNEPAYVRYVAEELAELKQVDIDTIAKHTTQNFYRLFDVSSNGAVL